MEARYLKEQLEVMLGGGAQMFLDFDNLQDTRILVQHVRDSDVMLVLLTADVMLRPWCILEIHAAVSAGIPLVGVTLRGKGYDHALAQRQLTLLDMELDARNPGACAVLRENGLEPLDAAYLLSTVIPRQITMEIDPAAPKGMLEGGLRDLVERMRFALPPDVDISKAEWLETRRKAAIGTHPAGADEGGTG